MNNIIKKIGAAVLIATCASVILYHFMFFFSYYVEKCFSQIEMCDGIPVYAIVSLFLSVLFFICSVRKNNKIKFFISVGCLSVFISCLSIMLFFDAYISSVNGVFVARANGNYGIVNVWGSEIVPFRFKAVHKFYNWEGDLETENRVCIFEDDNSSFYVATKDGILLPAERWTTCDFNEESYDEWKNEYGWLVMDEIYGFITCVGDKFNLIDSRGEKVIPEDFEQYVIYPNKSFLFVMVDGKWNAYDVSSLEKKALCDIDFEECKTTNDGMLLKHDGDVYLAHVDDEKMNFLNLSEQQRINEQNNRNMLLLMLLAQYNNNYQYGLMNNLYQNYNVIGRSRETIEAEIRKYEKEKSYCESHLGDGIAESMGYSGIISRYDDMIEDRKNELMMLGY